MSFELEGMDEFEKQLKKLEKQANEAVEGEVNINQIFTDEFMRENSKAENFQSFIAACPVKEDIKNIEQLNTPEMDDYVKTETEFDSWQDMLQAASTNYAAVMLKNAGFKLG